MSLATMEPVMFPATIEGDRIRLREWRETEAAAMHRWIGDPDVMRFVTWGSSSLAETEAHLKDILRQQHLAERTQYFLAVEDRRNLKGIGDAGFTFVEPCVAEIGYFLEPSFFGKGLGQEAAKLIISLAARLGANEIMATCLAANTRSEQVMKACGMTKVFQPDTARLRYRLQVPAASDQKSATSPSPARR